MVKILGHIILSALILVSSTGISLNMHFCHDHLVDIALNEPADRCCGSDEQNSGCCQTTEEDTRGHCEDESIAVDSDDYIVTSQLVTFEEDYPSDLFLASAILLYSVATEQYGYNKILTYKKPPLIEEVILSEIQVFLI